MGDPAFAAAATAWLASLPAGATVRWGHDLHRYIPGVHTGYIDVNVDGAVAGYNWLVTIIDTPDEGDDVDGIATIVVPHDTAVRGLVEDFTFVDGTVTLTDGTPGEETIDGQLWRTRGAWTTETLNATLVAWADRLAGRGDLTFVFDDDITSPMLAAAAEIAERIAAGSEETYDIGDGIHVAESVLDTLLALDPDDAAELSATVKEALGVTTS